MAGKAVAARETRVIKNKAPAILNSEVPVEGVLINSNRKSIGTESVGIKIPNVILVFLPAGIIAFPCGG